MTRQGTALVTGGAGFIGCALSPRLCDSFERVVVVDSLHPQVHADGGRPAALDERAELIVGDVSLAATWDRVLTDARPDVVLHLAAETGTAQSLKEGSRHATTNVVGTTQLLDALVRHDALPSRVLLLSSRAVYGEGGWRLRGELFYPGQRTLEMLDRAEWDFPDAEPTAMSAGTTEPRPVSIYGATKLSQEHVLTAWAQALGVRTAVLRLQNVYGPGQSLTNPYTGILSLFCRLARNSESIPLFEDGQVRRDFVFIDDVVSAAVRALTSTGELPPAIDIGSGEPQTIALAAGLIADAYGAPPPHVTGEYRLGDVRHAWADPAPAARSLGWQAEWRLEAGVQQLAAWVDAELS